FIQVGNWKPLTLEQISDDADQPAAKMLKPIAYDAILKIVVHQDRSQSHSPAEPEATPSVPQEIDECANVCEPRLSDSETADDDSDASGCNETLDVEPPAAQRAAELPATLEQMLHQFLQHQGPLFDVPASSPSSVGHYEPKMTRSPSPDVRRYNPTTGAVKPCFDTVYEVPMLQRWYSELQFPGKAQCLLYADELNSLPHRQTSPALSWQTVSNWFKNRRRQDRRNGVMPSVNAEILGQVC
ncbi:homeobox domain protein, partial [Aphelenchoides avenae]